MTIFLLLGKFYHLRFRVPTSTLKWLCIALVDSILSYGLRFKSNIDRSENMQIRFLKLLVDKKKTKVKCNGDYRKIFRICKILPVILKHKYVLVVNYHGAQEHDSLLCKVSNDLNTKSMTSNV